MDKKLMLDKSHGVEVLESNNTNVFCDQGTKVLSFQFDWDKAF
jgi:hypothetical protein